MYDAFSLHLVEQSGLKMKHQEVVNLKRLVMVLWECDSFHEPPHD